MRECKCAEGTTARYERDGRHYYSGPTGLNVHNCEYIVARNALIPRAEQMAERTGGKFLRCMDFLAKAEGLIR
jgi:hypothetical protein